MNFAKFRRHFIEYLPPIANTYQRIVARIPLTGRGLVIICVSAAISVDLRATRYDGLTECLLLLGYCHREKFAVMLFGARRSELSRPASDGVRRPALLRA